MIKLEMYTSPTCGPCKMMKPFMEEFIEDGQDIEIIDLADGREPFDQKGIRGTPTLIYYKDGQEYDRYVGYATKEMVRKKLTETV